MSCFRQEHPYSLSQLIIAIRFGAMRMRIAMFGHKRIPSREGGIEVVVDELASRMVQLGHEVTCYNRGGHHISGSEHDAERNLKAVILYKGIKLKTVATLNIKGLAAITSSCAAGIRSAFGNYDIVHIHAEGPAAISWLPKLLHKRVIVTIHGLDWQRAKWGAAASKYIKAGERQAVKNADGIIVLSRAVQEYFRSSYGRETVFIPNGVSKPEIRNADKIQSLWGLEKNSYVLFLGRIVPEKGIQYLIQAWKEVKTDKNLVIVGGSSDTNGFVKKLRESSGENVIFTGFQKGTILNELFSNAYIYCLPSDLEGMPLSLLEAMSYGNCCLVSDIPECADVVEEKAALFKKSDIGDLKDKLQMLIEHPEIVQRYKDEAADYICQKYNWDDVVTNTLKLYIGKGEDKNG